jgi:hypothetical protein
VRCAARRPSMRACVRATSLAHRSCSRRSHPPPRDPRYNNRRDDGKASVAYAMLCGKRPNQEDVAVAQWAELAGGAGPSGQVGLTAVMDGHGGPGAAEFVQANLFKALLANDKFPADPKAALGECNLAWPGAAWPTRLQGSRFLTWPVMPPHTDHAHPRTRTSRSRGL